MVHRTPWLWSEPHGLGLTHSQIDSNALANFQEQNLYTVAPLLLAKPTAKRLLKQAATTRARGLGGTESPSSTSPLRSRLCS